jgi:hypothetical protein
MNLSFSNLTAPLLQRENRNREKSFHFSCTNCIPLSDPCALCGRKELRIPLYVTKIFLDATPADKKIFFAYPSQG